MNFSLRITLYALFLILILLTSAIADNDNDICMRVGLSSFCGSSKGLNISSDSDYSVDASDKSKVFNRGEVLHISLSNGKINASSINLTFPIIESKLVISSEALISISSPTIKPRKYRGSIEITSVKGLIRVVNIIGMEEYLLSVVPSEMPASYPMEALKTQAITARTYASCIRTKHKNDGYDICDSQHCQMYLGAPSEKEKCTNAVLETSGMVISYNNTIASVLYSADCGGVTANYSDIYPGSSFPYLSGVSDPTDIPRKEWKYTSTLGDISKKLISAGVKLTGTAQNISIDKISSNGRVLSIALNSDSSCISVSSTKFRAAIGKNIILSSLFSLEYNNGIVNIKGKGFGHGIGLCQTGSKALAASPYNYSYEQIISHYFPGTTITQISDVNLNGKLIVGVKSNKDKLKIDMAGNNQGSTDVSVISDATF